MKIESGHAQLIRAVRRGHQTNLDVRNQYDCIEQCLVEVHLKLGWATFNRDRMICREGRDNYNDKSTNRYRSIAFVM